MVKLTVDDSGFSQKVRDTIGILAPTRDEAFQMQGRLLAYELIQRTPPFSGKTVKKMLDARGAVLSDTEIQNLSALAVGKRRVELDIRKVIFGVRDDVAPEARTAEVFLGQNRNKVYSQGAVTDWGKFQRCEGKDAVRIFATKSGQVYGVDFNKFMAEASLQDLKKTHDSQRGKRGRVTMAGQGDQVVGRWHWVNMATTKESIVKEFVALKQKAVGQARGGWAEAYIQLGGRMSRNGWVGRWANRVGLCSQQYDRDNVSITIVNQSKWASGGDPDRIIAKALEGRAMAIVNAIKRKITDTWGKGG